MRCFFQVVQKLTQMVGKNVKLYDMVLQFLRTLFLRTRNVHYCTLRAELLMSLHDLDVGDICTVDPCHKVCVPSSVVCSCWSCWGSLSTPTLPLPSLPPALLLSQLVQGLWPPWSIPALLSSATGK